MTVTVSRPDERDYRRFASDIQEQIQRDTDRPVTVNVRFIDYQEASADENDRQSVAEADVDPRRPALQPSAVGLTAGA